ncbi:MAG: hypothetical protein ABIH63_04670 [archaeon]
MLRRSNYHILYLPNDSNPSGNWHGFNVEVTKEFCNFAKKLDINHDSYEDLTYDMIRVAGFKSITRENFKGPLTRWDGGLLRHIIVPGNASSLVLSFDLPDQPKYISHNVDDVSQMSALMAVITRYILEVDYSIPVKKRRF